MTKFFLASLLAFTATPALAEPPAIVSTTVQTADLDLSSAKGQRALEQRLNQAVKDVCGTASDVDIAGKNEVRRCRVETLAIVAGNKLEMAVRDHDVDEPGHRTDRAIAVDRWNGRFGHFRPETNRAAMAST